MTFHVNLTKACVTVNKQFSLCIGLPQLQLGHILQSNVCIFAVFNQSKYMYNTYIMLSISSDDRNCIISDTPEYNMQSPVKWKLITGSFTIVSHTVPDVTLL